MNKFIKFAVVGVAIIGSLAALMMYGVGSHGMYYAEVADINANPEKYVEQGARVSGTVVPGTIVKDGDDLTFSMKDTSKEEVVTVKFTGKIPDAFEENGTVIVEGRYDMAAKAMNAKTLLAQCPSRYEGMDPAEHDKAMAEKKAA